MSTAESDFIAQHVEHGSDDHYAVLFTPVAQRIVVAAVFAFQRTMRELLTIQPDVAPTKITWWHEEIVRLRSGSAVHPICQTLNAHASDALCDALNDLLHGAVMDFNRIDVTDDELDDYLHRRDGAVHAALAALCGEHIDPALRPVLARLQGIPSMLAEARHPAHAEHPCVALQFAQSGSDQELERVLVERYDQAFDDWSPVHAVLPATAVRIALSRLSLPRILATDYGKVAAPPGPWRTLWTAWRSARQSIK
ncbi:MAG: squalene/phytoene synthase family protein [Gammaproteobacteria bacterium]